MDELLHHCLRELAFDGDLGCDVSRLSDFVKDFYAHSISHSQQKVDDSLCAFVWSLVVQQPTVLVGTIPPEITSQVYLAPQVSAKRKASARGEEHVITEHPALDLIPDAKSIPLADLQRDYGDRLRIAGDRDSIYAAITGTHIRFPKMSPMVYTALQIITRGRDDGVTVVQLGSQSKYDQKTCFYLVKQLTELNLVVKVRRGGVGTHFVIHRYFFERSPHWKAIRDEETQAEISSQNADTSTMEAQEDEESADVPSLGFTPIDARHLSSLPLVRGRVVKLLKASTNNMHVSNNMLVTIGFANPTKTDRRFFQRRIHELIQQGVVEKVVVPSKKKRSKVATVLCLRLVDETSTVPGDEVIVVPPTVENEEDSLSSGGFKLNVTIHKQISDLLEEAGTTGMTLTELSASLSQFDRRTIELILTRAEKFQPPSHLSDIGVAALLENSGRERRHRYFTVSAYRVLVEREKLDKSTAGYADVELGNAGGFLNLDPAGFYKNDEELENYQDSFKDDAPATLAKAQNPPKAAKQKQPRSKKQVLDEDGNAVAERSTKRSRGKRKAEEISVHNEIAEPVDKRPAKRRKGLENPVAQGDEEAAFKEDAVSAPSAPSKRPRGRPKKSVETSTSSLLPPKKRGRPPKSKLDEADADAGEGDDPPPKKRGRKAATSAPNDENETETNLRRSTRTRGRISFPVSDEEDQLTDDRVGGGEPAVAVAEPQRFGTDLPTANLNPDKGQSDVIQPVEEALPRQLADQSASRVEPSVEQEDPQIQEPTPENSAMMSIPAPRLIQEPPASTVHQEGVAEQSSAVPKSSLQPRPKVNVSNLRRENELVRVIEMLGGIVNIQTKELYEAHITLLETLAKAGEPASSPPGTRTDKRTVTATFNSLESRGKVKQLTTSVPLYLGNSRQTVIVYLPHITDAQLSTFLTELAQSACPPQPPQLSGRLIEEALDYGQEPRTGVRKAVPVRKIQQTTGIDGPERWGKDIQRAEQLFASDDNTIREVLLTERTTLCQLYRTIIAKCVRARELHLIVIRALEDAHPSLQIVSHEQNIIHLSFLSLDLPLGQYSQLVSPIAHSEELCNFMATQEGLNTIVRELPENFKNIIQPGKARASSKLLDSLELLRNLNIVTPLNPSTSGAPLFSCPAKDNHPTAFDAAPLDGWTSHTPLSAPTYWKFHDTVPLYHWAKSETDPPFLQNVSVGSVALAEAYWTLLEDACLDPLLHVPSQVASPVAPPNTNIAFVRPLCRRISWNARYKLSWHQTQYLKLFYNMVTGETPADDESGDAQLNKISWVISAPLNTVRDCYADMQNKMAKEADKARKRRKLKAAEKQAIETHEAKASLKKKAEDAHRQRDEEWAQLLQRVHPEPLKPSASLRVKRIHGRFLQSTTVHDIKKWEGELLNAIREAELISKKVLKTGKGPAAFTLPKKPTPIATVAPPVAVNPPERSVAELIAEQGPAIPQTRPPTKKQRKKKGEDQPDGSENKPRPPTQRRHRFMWTREYEELARDASAIIKARCRDAPRLDWGAFEQVFPAVPRNTVRQRVAHLREATGGETYLNRLEDTWYHLWIQHRGSAHLPDEYPMSPINFNLVQHVEFLRKHIDKNALRVGYMPSQHSTQPAIPESVSSLFEKFDVVESLPNAPSWDFVWNAIVEEGREKGMLSLPFTTQLDVLPLEESSAEDMCLAEAAVKMVLGTPSEVYEPGVATALLNSVGDDTVPVAAQNLLGRGVLSKLVRDPQKSQPGRLLKISEINQNALNGVINRDIFQDAAALDEQAAQQDDEDPWREWPLLATDGDLASLLQLVSENKVEFNIDTSHPQSCRPALDWNSKKADDDQIETSIIFRFIDLTDSASTSSSKDVQDATTAMTVDEKPADNHGTTVDGSPACCRKNTPDAVIDCPGCLDELWSAHSSHFNATELEIAQLVLWLGGQAGPKGVTKADLAVNTKRDLQDILLVVSKMTGEQHPFLHWVGYNSTLLVSAAYARSWTVALSQSPVFRIFPRRWLDIFGKRVLDVWEAALRAVTGAIVSRPGISQTELRWRLKSVYDKQEVAELLKTLLEENSIKNRFVPAPLVIGTIEPHAICALDAKEESCVFWFVNEEKHWYLI